MSVGFESNNNINRQNKCLAINEYKHDTDLSLLVCKSEDVHATSNVVSQIQAHIVGLTDLKYFEECPIVLFLGRTYLR